MKFFVLIFPICLIKLLNCSTCSSGLSITDSECFNQITYLELENKYYRTGHFAMNLKGDLIIEYSYNQYRLFLGFRNDGKFYFPEITKEIELQDDTINSAYIRRYESINSFISLINDTNKQKEYLLSISSYITVLELYDFENGNDSYNITESVNFFNFDLGIYPYVFQILEAKIDDKIIYFCIYLTENDNGNSYELFINKFGFLNSNFEVIKFEQVSNFPHIQRTRIISSVIIDYCELIAIFYFYDNNYYYFILYDFNLVRVVFNAHIYIGSPSVTDGLFIKAIYLNDKYLAILYFQIDYHIAFNIITYTESGKSLYISKEYYFNNKDLLPLASMNEFLKIDDDRLVFISILKDPYTTITSNSNYENSNKDLFIMFFDLYNQYTNIKVRYYYYNFQNSKISKFSNEISGFIYNGFLAFTGSVLSPSNDVFSIFLMFSYPNGTDTEIDIYPYLTDIDGYDNSNNLYNYLMSLMKIDNNIFGYEKVEQIKIVSKPEEIIFININDNLIASNDSIIDINYSLKQNTNMIKENKYYYLDYQFIVKEPDYDIFYSNTYGVIEDDSLDLRQYFTPRILCGRTNTLKFKLCHQWCKTCLRMGNYDYDQKCESCLEEYSYNYNENSKSECFAEGYFFDSENKIILACSPDNSKFFIDIINNKKICFKSDYDCPTDYQDYNETSKECKYLKIIKTTTIEVETISEIANITIIKPPSLNEGINQLIDNDLLKNYTIKNDSIEIKGENNSMFQLTTTNNELNRYNGELLNENNLSIIVLGDCETTLKLYN